MAGPDFEKPILELEKKIQELKSFISEKKIDLSSEVKKLEEKLKINPAGEGGEFESLVVNCPLFKKKLDLEIKDVVGEGNSWRGIF